MKDIINKYYPVLDNGFIAVKDFMGDDDAIEQMARVSYEVGNRPTSDRRTLLRYLMRHRHTSPFERCEIVFHVGLPIFVARQWIRHRTASVNEISGRYSILPSIFYTPTQERCTKQSKTNKQGSSKEECYNIDEYDTYVDIHNDMRNLAVWDYHESIKHDLAREVARIDLPLSTYTYWYWKIDLHNLFHFLGLRLDAHAQWEIRQYARIIAAVLKQWVPDAWSAFEDYQLSAVTFTRADRIVLNNIINTGYNPYNMDDDTTLICRDWALCQCMNKREWEEFLVKLSVPMIFNCQLPEPKDWSYFHNKMQESAVDK